MTTVNGGNRNNINGDSVIMMFSSSLVKHAASPQLRLPANFVGVQSVRQDFNTISSIPASQAKNAIDDDINKTKISHLKANNDVKFCVVDENGNERRMTKAEKKAKKFQIAQAKKEAKKEAAGKKKRKLEDATIDDANKKDTKLHSVADNEAIVQCRENLQPSEGAAVMSHPYHQLPLDSTTIEQELNEFKGKRGSMPPVILSPPMALQFLSRMRSFPTAKTVDPSEMNTDDEGDSAILVYDHNLSQEWANRLKQQCILPAEAVRQKEDLRPLAYRLQPEPWERLRPSLEENPVVTTSRINVKHVRRSPASLSSTSGRTENGERRGCDMNPKPRDWVPLTCRPCITFSSEKNARIQHDDILSIVFEYLHRETPYYISCGAKFGSDFLVYDGPRDKRHAFAGLRVLSRSTSSMTKMASKSTLAVSSSQNDQSSKESVSNDDVVELPLPTAYSLTGFVRCLNTAGKLALLATVHEVPDSPITEEKELSRSNVVVGKKRYQIALVDVALEKVIDVHKRKNRGRPQKRKLQKRRDVTQTLSKT